MRTSFTRIQCVKICQQDCIRDGSLTLICRNSRLDIIELATFRIWFCLSIKNQDQNVKLRVFLHLENRRKLTVLLWTVIVITVKQYSRQWDATITFVPVKKLASPEQNRISSEEIRREKWMICDENTLKRKDTTWKKCGSVTGGKVSKPIKRSKITSEPTFPRKDPFLQTLF